MKPSGRIRRNLRIIGRLVAIVGPISGVFSWLTSGPDAGFEPFAQGVVDGGIIVALITAYILFGARGYLIDFLKRLNFLTAFLFNSIVYTLLFLGGRVAGQYLIKRDLSLFHNNFFVSIIFAMILLGMITFIMQLNRLLGQNVLRNFIAGTYHTPVEEERLFMFLDLESSTTIAERLGNQRFHMLLNQFFYDLTEAIIETEGSIYKYVGDEVIVTWPKAKGLENGNCVRCFLLMVEKMREQAPRYRQQFGLVPGFRAGLHGGMVIAGELGDVKQEIAFLGDVLNTTSRIMGHCREKQQRLLVSGWVINRINLPEGYAARSEGTFQPRGKQELVEIFSVAQAR